MQIWIRETPVKIDWFNNPLQWGPSDLQNRISTATFVYESLQNPSVTFIPAEGDDVRILDDATASSLFTGHIAQVERGGDPVGRRYAISCQDLNYLFDKIRLPVDFVYSAGRSDGSIALDLLFYDASNNWGAAAKTPGKTIQMSYPGPTQPVTSKAQNLPAVTFKAGASLTEALNQLSTLVGGVAWYADAAIQTALIRAFHWNDVGGTAPFVLTTAPGNWPNDASFFYNYKEFSDRTTHYHRVRVDNGAGIVATADDWAAYAANRIVQLRQYGAFDPNTYAGNDLILEGARVTDSTLTTQAQVTQRAYQELNKGRIRKTIHLSFDRKSAAGISPIIVGMLVDVVHTTWDSTDVDPTPHVCREVGTHSNVRGEMVPGARGRYLVQKVTPRLKAKGSPTLYSYDLELGDYEDSLAATLARVV